MSLRQLWLRLVRSPPIPFPLPGYTKKLQFPVSLAVRPQPATGSDQWMWASGTYTPGTVLSVTQLSRVECRRANQGLPEHGHCVTTKVRSLDPWLGITAWELWSEKSCLILWIPVCCVGRMTDRRFIQRCSSVLYSQQPKTGDNPTINQ